MAAKHSTHRCPLHNDFLVRRRNLHGNGIFYGCPCFESSECKVTWSKESGWCGLPGKVANASKTRGACMSLREKALSYLQAHGLPAKDALDIVNEYGPQEALRLVA